MAFSGYLIKVGNYSIPLELMQAKSYKAKLNTVDEDAYNDNTGKLHRSVVQKIPIVSFDTMDLDEKTKNEFFDNCRANYTIAKERKAIMSVYCPELGKYVSQEMYMVDPEIPISEIDEDTNNVYYEPFTITFKGYGD